MRHQLRETMLELAGKSAEQYIEERYQKFRTMGNAFIGGEL